MPECGLRAIGLAKPNKESEDTKPCCVPTDDIYFPIDRSQIMFYFYSKKLSKIKYKHRNLLAKYDIIDAIKNDRTPQSVQTDFRACDGELIPRRTSEKCVSLNSELCAKLCAADSL